MKSRTFCLGMVYGVPISLFLWYLICVAINWLGGV